MSAATFFDRVRRVLFEASFYLVLILGFAFTFFNMGPYLETRFWPPVSKLNVLSLTPGDDNTSVLDAEFTKRRDCEYLGISWFKALPDGKFERVPVILLRKDGDTSSPNRPVGTQRAGPWIIGVPPAELRTSSFARLSHRCHPFWLTTTDFYP